MEQFFSIFGGSAVVYSFVAIVANDFQWAIDHILDIGIAAFGTALFLTVWNLFNRG